MQSFYIFNRAHLDLRQ